MAKKSPRDAVQFTRESAERIAGVVRSAELGSPAAAPLTFDARFTERMPKQVRAATFSGAWPIGATKSVTLSYSPTATVNAVNLSWPISASGYVNENCLVGKEGTNWWLVVPVLQTATAIFVTQTAAASYCSATASSSVVSGIEISATLNTNNCTITVSKTVTTASVSVVSSTATAMFIASHATSQYLRLRVP